MGVSIRYRSTDTMHPALAYQIKQHAARLVDGYRWSSCEPVLLDQQSDGHLGGASKPNFFPAEVNAGGEHNHGIPDGTVLALAEVLCTLSREHEIDWDIGHDCESQPIGCIRRGRADDDLVEQLETFGTIGDLLDEMQEEDLSDATAAIKGIVRGDNQEADDDEIFGEDLQSKKLAQWQSVEFGVVNPSLGDDPDGDDDDRPHVLKFPGV